MTSKAEAAYLTLRQHILDAQLAPGAPLRHDRLREMHDIGWTPLREALQRLEAEQLVISKPNRGFFVAEISEGEISDLLNTRLVLEEPLLEEAMRLGDEDWEVGIVEAHHRLSRAANILSDLTLENLRDWDARHRGFHLSLINAARSVWQKRLYNQVWDHLRRHQFHMTIAPLITAKQAGRAPDDTLMSRLHNAMNGLSHERLMRAVLDRDTETARLLLKLHVGETLGVYRAVRQSHGTPDHAA
ncbi:DNA-binding GntR family transcriptional regulator [Roseibium hamelinense]|uniref:DNA-binding GntR family transcriptional regulator n=1 Tax=Roseibium hamelinense TaxID=150831 RepID=A0A562TIS3_9HYPH|nr:GntR family transcriptional regulator [Roseibium hamelinense]MTI43113.1 GntR family transcriptional regulator [Roseibium hamelinense]TWI92540.1 DNA-binding GntR family transcriptional regulator [Roseibium hamelinense]